MTMFSIFSVQDGLTGSAWGDWSLYTASPLRLSSGVVGFPDPEDGGDFDRETGVQSPTGYWDPLGLSADGNVKKFLRRREVEIKHGRVAMCTPQLRLAHLVDVRVSWPLWQCLAGLRLG